MRRTIAASLGTAVVLSGLATFAPSSQASSDAGVPWGKRTIRVVPPGQSIQAAVDRARPGDVIQLRAGRYDGGILVRKRLTIRGVGDRSVLRPGGRDHCATVRLPGVGICVIGTARNLVRGVTIERLSVQNFRAFGVFGNYTDRLTVHRVLARHNGEYGISEFNSTRGRFVQNRAIDTGDEAGLYVGDIANARGTVVAGNLSSGNALGLLVRHARNLTVSGNAFVGNCTGIALVDDSQPGGQGNTRVRGNNISRNNKRCAAHEEIPPLQGTGVLFFGGDHNTVERNVVRDNRGPLPYSGGIVLFPGTPPLNRPAQNNLIARNLVRGNSPFDLVDNSGSNTNRFVRNNCATSRPGGLCRR